MVKRFCDICNKEINSAVGLDSFYRVKVDDVIRGSKSSINYDDVCLNCAESIKEHIKALQTKKSNNQSS